MEVQANNPLDGAGDSGSIQAATSAFEAILSGKPDDEESAQEQAAPEQDAADDVATDDEQQVEGEDAPDDEDAADEGDEVEDDENEDEEPAQQKFTVTIDGAKVDVELPELLSGYMRTADYTRKSQANAAARKEIEARAADLYRQHEEYAQILPILREKIQQQGEQEPNWLELSQTDPDGYMRERARWDVRHRQLQDVESEQARMNEIQKQQYEQSMGLRLQEEGERLISVIPSWSDGKVAESERREILEYAQNKLGYDREELSHIYDHRAVATLRKAWKYDQMMSKKDQVKPVKTATAPTLAPGASRAQSRPTSELTRAKQRLAKTGTVRDAQAVFERMLSR
jgi:hypothetical protein